MHSGLNAKTEASAKTLAEISRTFALLCTFAFNPGR